MNASCSYLFEQLRKHGKLWLERFMTHYNEEAYNK